MLASSELSDMTPVLAQAEKATGVKVRPPGPGPSTRSTCWRPARRTGSTTPLWLSSNDYLRLRPEAAKKVVSETPVMSSPVAIGVKAATVRPGSAGSPTRSPGPQVEEAVADGKLTYGMTDPVRSNSGFSTLISVASGLSGRAVGADRRGRGEGAAAAEGVLQRAEADLGFLRLAGDRLRPARHRRRPAELRVRPQ